MKSFISAIFIVLGYLVIQMLVQLSFSIFAITMNFDSVNEMHKWLNCNILLIATISNILSVIIYILLFQFKKEINKRISFNFVFLKKFTYLALSVISASLLFTLFTSKIENQQETIILESQIYFNSIIPYLGDMLKLSSLLLLAPIAEELVFRGLVLKYLEKKFSSITSILISGLLFGGIHFFAGGIDLVVGATIMGILFGVAFVQTRSLLVAIVIHAFANLPEIIVSNFNIVSQTTTIVIVSSTIFLISATLIVRDMAKSNPIK